ncbi:MAG: histidine kinase dimerization/phosphoacceptor domain -containing protein [Methanobacteriaceae archaeon]|nr:histidine kinase dimerization/phosphoacceptor domain -containing protein [Methanobacteriaceae archaeon]
MLASSHDRFHENYYQILWFGSIILFLAILRQILSLRENRELYIDAEKEIIERKKIEKALKESESNYRAIFENTGTATLIIEDDTIISMVNTEFEVLSGFKKEEIQGKMSWTEFVADDDLERMKYYHEMRRKDPSSVPRNYEFKLIDSENNIKNIYLTVSIIPGTNKSLVSLVDITDRKKFEKELKSSLEEKELLLREIHHRVKNNLQIISSLLSLQSRNIKDEKYLGIFKESQNRVKSVSHIHEYLYQSRKMTKINLSDYIRRIITDLRYSYGLDPEKVQIKVEIEKINLNIETATPLGLIITELVSNSIKHAFPDKEKGEITIKITRINNKFLLEVSDNGVGISEDLILEKSDSLGLKLVNTLVEQIDGNMELDVTKGTNFKINFKELKYRDRL